VLCIQNACCDLIFDRKTSPVTLKLVKVAKVYDFQISHTIDISGSLEPVVHGKVDDVEGCIRSQGVAQPWANCSEPIDIFTRRNAPRV
jgi:hypothetical protein